MNDKKESKTLKIASKNFEEFEEESVERLEKFEKDEDIPHTVNFEDPTKLRKVLTAKRIELIEQIMTDKAENMQQLADILGRGLKEVSQDLHLLEEYGIVKLEKDGRAKKPVVPYDRIDIEIGIESGNNRENIEKSPA